MTLLLPKQLSSVTTGISPFFANKGYHSSLQVQITCKLITDLVNTYTRLKQAIAEAQARYQGPADARCSKATYLLA